MTDVLSYDAYRRALSEQFKRMRESLDLLRESFIGAPENIRKERAEEFTKMATDLLAMVAASDQPHWLVQLRNAAKQVAKATHADSQSRFLQLMMQVGSQVEPIEFAARPTSDFDFDAIYERYRDQEQLPELFDSLIETITKIIESGEIQLIAVMEALQNVRKVLKANRTGSFVAVRHSAMFAMYCNTLVNRYLRSIPILGELLKAWDDTAKKIESKVARVEQDMIDESRRLLVAKIPHIDRINAVADSLDTLALPNPTKTLTREQ